jgi:amino acid adenylation domain-containing protein
MPDVSKSPPQPPPIQKHDFKQASLSFSQESLWFLQQLNPENTAYNSSLLLKFTGGIDQVSLQQALNEVIRRHESQRTVYPNRSGKPVQIIRPFQPFSMPFVDFSNLPEDSREQAVRKYVSDQSNQAFDLQRGPSTRFAHLHRDQNADYLFYCTHHINFDAWSKQIFISELLKLYGTFRSGRESTLPELPIQYADYAAWQKVWLSGETLRVYIEHWKEILPGDLPALDLHTDRLRPVLQSFPGARYHFPFSPHLSSQVKRFCQKERLTLFQLLLAAYALLLMRHTGQEDIIVGCPFANRSRPELDGMVGLFVNTLPIRVNLAGNPGVREFLKRVQAVVQDAYSWQAAPFEILVSEISPQRDLSRNPVFQLVINLKKFPKQQTFIDGFEVENIPWENSSSPFDFSLEFNVNENGELDTAMEYNVDLYDETTIISMAAHYQNLLSELLAGPDRLVSELEMLSPSERRQILVEWNNTAREYPRQSNVQRLFEEQATKTPDALAVVFGGKKASYRELDRRANQLARHLAHLGAGQGMFIGVTMDRSMEMVVAMLAILKAGGTYVPLDPTYPPERLGFMAEDTNIGIIISLRNCSGNLPTKPAGHLQVVMMDTQADEIAQYSPEDLSVNVEPMASACVIYTSGSTGSPKGICIPHRAIIRLVRNTNYIRIAPEDRIGQTSNMSFDAATFEIWGALLNGARLVGVAQEVLQSPVDLARVIREQGINVIFLTTALFNQVASITPEAFAPVRDLLFGGEAVTPLWVRTVLTSGPPRRLVHMYGPAETTTFATWYLVREVAESDGTVPIGMPIANTTAYVLDGALQPVPVGVAGTLYIGGDGLAVGYQNRPELTSEKFIGNPFYRDELKTCLPKSDRLYNTGDLVRRRKDGSIEFLGRLDNQVKLRGFRVELGEIEGVLKQYPGIRDATVLVRENQPGDKWLVGYIVPAPGMALGQGQLRDYLKERLPGYMVPAAFVFVDAFPLTANGKVDRKALLAFRQDKLVSQEYAAPRTLTEQTIARIWMEVLDVPRVGISDVFFEIGGNSLSAVQVMVRVQHELEVALPIHKIFQFPQLADLALQVDLEQQHQKRPFAGQVQSGEYEEFLL